MALSREETVHESVMKREILQGIEIKRGGVYVDLTGGGGGHASGLWQAVEGDLQLIVLDRDRRAIERIEARFKREGISAECICANFADLSSALSKWRGKISGMIADLGLSSDQLDDPDRGFGFLQAGPLDMRMDEGGELTAADIVNTWEEKDLATLFFSLGEERFSRQIARRIVMERAGRAIETTADLASIVVSSLRRKGVERSRRHPATRVFQALRIEVNGELKALEGLLKEAPGVLADGGRLAVLSFHSLEDRCVKRAFKEKPWRAITRKPLIPADDEMKNNPRSRSAKLRIAEYMGERP